MYKFLHPLYRVFRCLSFRQIQAYFIFLAFLLNTLGPIPLAQAQEFRLPAPGVMVPLSPSFNPPMLKGIKINPNNPLNFEFVLDQGDHLLNNDQLKNVSSTLIKYFLASLTIPERDLWVNLSPYEKNRIIPNSFGLTEMGRDLLAEDYMLKQITASLIYPEDGVGKKFWKRIYEEASKRYGTSNIPVNTYNKVWIVPQKAVVYENEKIATAYVVESKLKVMLEQDYLSLEKHQAGSSMGDNKPKDGINALGSQIVREIIIPELTKEVNEDKNFAVLRQVYNSLILAAWYKKKIKDSILKQVYADKSKVGGISIEDSREKEKIYQRYLQAFKKGVYNYIKQETDPLTHEAIPRKYFSGGEDFEGMSTNLELEHLQTTAHFQAKAQHPWRVLVNLAMTSSQNPAQMSQADIDYEKVQARVVAEKLRTVLDPHSPFSKQFLQGGYDKNGYGVAAEAVIDGSNAIGDEGNQGYYVNKTNIPDDNGGDLSGHDVFIKTVDSMKDLFQRRRPKLIIKVGIGGEYTPFQGIADVFQVIDPTSGDIIGEYELGQDFEKIIGDILHRRNARWDQIVLIPSSKSGETDETMKIFEEIFKLLLEKIANQEGTNGTLFANAVFDYLHQINFDQDGNELPMDELFNGFRLQALVDKINEKARAPISEELVKKVLGKVLGNMFFETTDRPEVSRLSAFIRHSKLNEILGKDNSPVFGAMFDNVGGRWTGDLHMMVFLAFHKLDPDAYWQARYNGILQVRKGEHQGNTLGNTILDKEIKRIAVVVPDEMFWFGKSTEQNFNESIWQEGFANLRAIKASNWHAQSQNYHGPECLVINLSQEEIDPQQFQVEGVEPVRTTTGNQKAAEDFARLFTTFYGMTHTVGTRLIARALKKAGLNAEQIDVNNLENPATQIMQENLFLRQPFVELGKGLLRKYFEDLQARQRQWERAGKIGISPIKQLKNEVISEAQDRKASENISGPQVVPAAASNPQELAELIFESIQTAQKDGRTFVPFIYLEGQKNVELREALIKLGIEWVLQGTGDQHISYQQVLAQPGRYLPFFISFVPKVLRPGMTAIGFARSYLDGISSNLIRHSFAKFSYEALVNRGGKGVFVSMLDTPKKRSELIEDFRAAVHQSASLAMTAQVIQALQKMNAGLPALHELMHLPNPTIQTPSRNGWEQLDASAERLKGVPVEELTPETAMNLFPIDILPVPERNSLRVTISKEGFFSHNFLDDYTHWQGFTYTLIRLVQNKEVVAEIRLNSWEGVLYFQLHFKKLEMRGAGIGSLWFKHVFVPYARSLHAAAVGTLFTCGESGWNSFAERLGMTIDSLGADDSHDTFHGTVYYRGLLQINSEPGARQAIKQVLRDAEKIQGRFKHVTIIGGDASSVLGGEVFHTAFSKVATADPKHAQTLFFSNNDDSTAIDRELDGLSQRNSETLGAILNNLTVVIISRSGTDSEAESQWRHFLDLYRSHGIDPRSHFIIYTNVGTPMDWLDFNSKEMPKGPAREKQELFEEFQPTVRLLQLSGENLVPGRLSSVMANSTFLPMALQFSKYKLAETLQRMMNILGDAEKMNTQLEQDQFVRLAARLFYMAWKLKRNKLTFIVPDEFRDLPKWARQLFLEDGKGIDVVYGEDPNTAGNDRMFVRVNFDVHETQKVLVDSLRARGCPVFDISLHSIDEIGGLMMGMERVAAFMGSFWEKRDAIPEAELQEDLTTLSGMDLSGEVDVQHQTMGRLLERKRRALEAELLEKTSNTPLYKSGPIYSLLPEDPYAKLATMLGREGRRIGSLIFYQYDSSRQRFLSMDRGDLPQPIEYEMVDGQIRVLGPAEDGIQERLSGNSRSGEAVKPYVIKGTIHYVIHTKHSGDYLIGGHWGMKSASGLPEQEDPLAREARLYGGSDNSVIPYQWNGEQRYLTVGKEDEISEFKAQDGALKKLDETEDGLAKQLRHDFRDGRVSSIIVCENSEGQKRFLAAGEGGVFAYGQDVASYVPTEAEVGKLRTELRGIEDQLASIRSGNPGSDFSMGVKGPGGIDLTSVDSDIQTSGRGIQFHLDPAMINHLKNATGFVPVIIDCQPIKNLRQYLGLALN